MGQEKNGKGREKEVMGDQRVHFAFSRKAFGNFWSREERGIQ